MLFMIQAFEAGVRTAMDRDTRQRLRLVTDPFAQHLREISISLRDVNGPGGAIDKSCTVTARLSRGGTIEIEQTRKTIASAIRMAAKNLRNRLARIIGRRGHANRRSEYALFRRPKELR